jgi:transposase InsO family protein
MSRESGPIPCILGNNNSRKFRGDLFLNILTQFGIRTWYSQRYTPQHNGKIEQFW